MAGVTFVAAQTDIRLAGYGAYAPVPSGVQNGDIALAFISLSQARSFSSVPAGWNLVAGDPLANLYAVYWRKCAASDGGQLFGWPYSTAADSVTTCVVYRNVDQNH